MRCRLAIRERHAKGGRSLCLQILSRLGGQAVGAEAQEDVPQDPSREARLLTQGQYSCPCMHDAGADLLTKVLQESKEAYLIGLRRKANATLTEELEKPDEPSV